MFVFPVPTPAPAGDEPPPPLLREDAQAIIFGGYDPGSGGGVGIFNAALTFPHLSLTRIGGDDFWGQKRVGVNLGSGIGPVIQYQRIFGGRTPGATDDPFYRSQISFGVGANAVDLQIRHRTIGEDGKPKYDSAILDVQLPVSYAHQYLTDAIGGSPTSPLSREANQFGAGINIDYHITPHISLIGQFGIQYSNAGGFGLSPFILGIGTHSEAQ